MKIEPRFLRSKLGRRIVTLFVLCALLPIAGVAVVSFTQVRKQLDEQGKQRLEEASKSKGMEILERLELLELSLGMIAANLSGGLEAPIPLSWQGPDSNLRSRCHRLDHSGSRSRG